MAETAFHPVAVELADLKARLVRAELDMAEARSDIKAIRSTLDQARGGYRTLMLVGGLAGAVGAVATKIIGLMGTLPR